MAARLSVDKPQRMALTIGGISLAGGVMAMSLVDGPAWLALELPLLLVGAWLAGRLETKRRSSLTLEDSVSYQSE